MILSVPILMLAPPLGILEVFWAIIGITFLHKRQILVESLMGMSWSRSWCLGKLRYLISSTLFHHAEGPVMNLQTIFPPKAKLRYLGDLMPRPPRSWGWITCFQLIKLNFFLSCFPPCHKKWRRMPSILWWKEAGAWRRVNWYNGREDIPDFRRVRRPAGLSHIEPHCCTFLFILSIMVSQTSALKGPALTRMPKYEKWVQS